MGPRVPRTVDTIRCLTLKPAVECPESMVHVFGPGVWAPTDTSPVTIKATPAAAVIALLRMQISPSRHRIQLRRRPAAGRFRARAPGAGQARLFPGHAD